MDSAYNIRRDLGGTEMIKVLMHGCNGKMGQMITGLIRDDEQLEIAAGVDAYTGLPNDYPVFENI